MNDQYKLALYRGLDAGIFSDQQKLQAYKALDRDAPDEEVSDLLTSLRFSSLNSGKSLKELADDRSGRDTNAFDYDTGADSGLRAALSFGETDKDKEAILNELVGSDGYIRDAGGNLALTEAGQLRRGMDPIGKNLIVDEEGFSFRDITADFAGSVPEVLGAVAGGIGGTILGGPLGGVAGAATYGGAAQAIEEMIEGFLGVQTQSVGEVAQDVAKEAALSAAGDAIGGAVILAGRGILGGGKKLAGMAGGRAKLQEISDQQLSKLESLVGRGAIPSLEALGAPRPISYAQKFMENAGKQLGRIDNNINFALTEKDRFLEGISAAKPGELGQRVLTETPAQFSKLNAARNNAQDAVLRAVNDSLNVLTGSAKAGVDLDSEALQSVVRSFGAFEQVAQSNFKAVDDLLSSVRVPLMNREGETIIKSGGDLKIFDTYPLRKQLTEYFDVYKNLAAGPVMEIRDFLDMTKRGASFKQMAALRKAINDSLYFDGTLPTAARKPLDNLRNDIDVLMDEDSIADFISVNRNSLDEDDLQMLSEAAKLRGNAMSHYKEGIRKFEDLERAGIIRSVKNLQEFPEAGITSREIADRFYDRVVQPRKPFALRAFFSAVDNPKEMQELMSRRFIDDALEKAGMDAVDPGAFNGKKFAKEIRGLGKEVGAQLFGKNWDEVRKLSVAIGRSSAKDTISADDVSRILRTEGGENIANKMQQLLDIQTNMNNALKTSVIKDIQAGKFENYDSVVRALTNPKLTPDEVRKIMRFFENRPELRQDMKDVVMMDIFSSVDENIFKSPKSASSLKEELGKYKKGTLEEILGKETSDAINAFADDLVILGDVGKEGSIAAGSVWANMFKHPINTVLAVSRFRFLAKALGSKTAAEKFLQMRRAAGSNAELRSDAMMSAINQAMVDEGVDIGGAASKAGKILGPISTAVGAAQRTGRQSALRGISGSPDDEAAQPEMERKVFTQERIPELPQIRQPIPVPQAAPMTPIQRLQSNVNQELRRRASEDPRVAASLLGGLGNASLLNR